MTGIVLAEDIKDKKEESQIELVCGIFFQESGVLTLYNKSKERWELPGGKKEDYDKNYEITMMRELDEELRLFNKDVEIGEINRYIELINQVPTNKIISSEDHKEIKPILYYLRLREGIRVSPRPGSGYFGVKWMDIQDRGFKMNNLSKLTDYVCESIFSGDLDLFKKRT